MININIINLITSYNFSDTRFKDFTVAVGNSFDPSNKGSFDKSVFSACVTVTGNLPSADNLDMICDPPLEGRYLAVHMHGATSGIIQLCEVVVYDHLGATIFLHLISVKLFTCTHEWKQQHESVTGYTVPSL